MQKRQIALAIGAVLAASAAHAKDDWSGPDSVVTMYGKLYPEIVEPSGSGATDAGTAVATITNGKPTGGSGIIKRTEVQSSNSRIGWRGYEKIGRELRAIWQLETEFHVDSNDSAFAGRNSFVGLASRSWGDVKLGRMDTPFKKYGDQISFLGVGSGNFVSTSNVLRKTGFGTSSASSFHLRRQNAVQYESPDWHGLDAAVQYSTDEADTPSRHPHVWSGGVRYQRGPVTLSLAHERHWDLFGGSRNVGTASMSNFRDNAVRSRDKATQAMIVYRLAKGQQLEADYIRKEYEENPTVTGRFQSYRNNAYQLKWDARWSRQWRTQVAYVHSNAGSCKRLGAACDTGGLDGTQWNLGVAYYLSQRTMLFLIGSILDNGRSAVYNNEELQEPAVGEDIKQYAMGISHSW
ncbi:MAG TPA: porin [Usitatibacter sp.]|nr:porin [Usitatibacter sp.]